MEKKTSSINPLLTIAATFCVLLVALVGTFYSEALRQGIDSTRSAVNAFLEWYYVALVAFLFLFITWLGMGRYRFVRLGQDHEKPEFRTLSWLAMLFAAGTGVGLIFWSIAEPIMHFAGNPFSSGKSPEAAAVAMRLTYFHWGLNGWAIFSTVALILAYFGFRRQRPLTISATLSPVIGKYSQAVPGYLLDLFAVMATVFGVATTLGLGASQMSTGLTHVLGTEPSTGQQMWIIAGVTLVATLSVAAGVRRGVRLLSELNLWMTLVLLGFFFLFGPTHYQMALLVQSVGNYLQHLIEMSFWTGSNQGNGWQSEWTVFFWGWWLAWSPFVGMFIARISRGRTIGEFVFGVMLLPSLISFIWIAVLGGTALHMEIFGDGGIVKVVQQDVASALFTTIKSMDLPGVLTTMAGALSTLLIATYFITSADSGTLVITTLLCNGGTNPPRWLRILWGLGLGLLTAVLLLAGGIDTLQSAVIMAALPFSIIIILMVVGFHRELLKEPQSPLQGKRRHISHDPLIESSSPPEENRQERDENEEGRK